MFFDDTCYYLPFDDEAHARLVADVLNSEACQRFLLALTFPDSKRPITVELLHRLNLAAIAEEAGLGARWRSASRVSYGAAPNVSQFELVMESTQPAKTPPPGTKASRATDAGCASRKRRRKNAAPKRI